MIKGNPDVTYAAHAGTPQMSPPNDSISATDILKPGARGPAFTVSGTDASTAAPEQPADAAPVDATTVPRGAPSAPGNSLGFEIIAAPNDPNAVATTPAPAADSPARPSTDSTLTPSNNVPVLTPTASVVADPGPSANPAPAREGSPNGSAAASAPAGAESTSTAPPAAGAATAGTSAQAKTDAAKTDKADPKEESTSKKKKGVKKLIPW
jgi:hypothetical protein